MKVICGAFAGQSTWWVPFAACRLLLNAAANEAAVGDNALMHGDSGVLTQHPAHLRETSRVD
jgi:hypothetical protein